MKLFGIMVILLFTLREREAHTVSFRKDCAVVKTKIVDFNKLLGPWYVMEYNEDETKCVKYDFKWDTVNKTISIKKGSKTGTLDVTDLNNMKSAWQVFGFDYFILDTNYKNYTICYECQTYFSGLFNIARWSVIILSRQPELDQIYMDRVMRVLAKNNISRESMKTVTHKDCGKEKPRGVVANLANFVSSIF